MNKELKNSLIGLNKSVLGTDIHDNLIRSIGGVFIEETSEDDRFKIRHIEDILGAEVGLVFKEIENVIDISDANAYAVRHSEWYDDLERYMTSHNSLYAARRVLRRMGVPASLDGDSIINAINGSHIIQSTTQHFHMSWADRWDGWKYGDAVSGEAPEHFYDNVYKLYIGDATSLSISVSPNSGAFLRVSKYDIPMDQVDGGGSSQAIQGILQWNEAPIVSVTNDTLELLVDTSYLFNTDNTYTAAKTFSFTTEALDSGDAKYLYFGQQHMTSYSRVVAQLDVTLNITRDSARMRL